jgi:hypothetical protein
METQPLDQLEPKKRNLEGAGSILAMGIISIPFCLAFFGVVLSIGTLIRASKQLKLYETAPKLYTQSSYQKVKAGRICAFVSLGLLILVIGFLMITQR